MHFAMLVLRNKMSHENLQLAELAAFYCRSDRQICGIERDQGSLYCMIQIRLAGPYGADQVVVCIQLMEPGAVYMIQNLFIQILHELSEVVCIFLVAGYMEQNCGSIDCFCQSPVHSVVNNRFAVPIGGVNDTRSAVSIPCVFDCTVVQVFCNSDVFGSALFVALEGGQSPLGDQTGPFDTVTGSCAVRLELIVRTIFVAFQISNPLFGEVFRNSAVVCGCQPTT